LEFDLEIASSLCSSQRQVVGEIAEPVPKRKRGISLLARTGGGEIAEPIPKRKRGISLLAKTGGGRDFFG